MPPRRDNYTRAMSALHVGSRPDSLPCRQEQYEEIEDAITGLLEDDSGGCIYISGVPGTGKTATVQILAQNLQKKQRSTNKFRYLEINGLKIPEPGAAYTLLWEAVSNPQTLTGKGKGKAAPTQTRTSSKEALKRLTRYFEEEQSEEELPLVVLMDELDQLMTTKQDVVYNFFNWPTFPGSRLVVIAVANTHDMPERAMSGKVRSRLGMTRINFKPYQQEDLRMIVTERLRVAKAIELFDEDAIKLASMRIANVSGDARRMLDICRRAVEVAKDSGTPKVTAIQINAVIAAMQKSPTAAYLRQCSLQERIMLASLYKCVRRTGVAAISWGEITHQHGLYVQSLVQDNEPTEKPSLTQLRLVLNSLNASRAVIVEDGPSAARKAEEERKVMLNLEPPEVERVLSEVGGEKWKHALGV